MSTKKIKYGIEDLEQEVGTLTFASLILSHREAEELTQQEMANILGISKQSLCDLEKGRRIPSPSRAANIAVKLEMMPESFVEIALQDSLREASLNYIVKISRNMKAS